MERVKIRGRGYYREKFPGILVSTEESNFKVGETGNYRLDELVYKYE
jgi:hypothetical protein